MVLEDIHYTIHASMFHICEHIFCMHMQATVSGWHIYKQVWCIVPDMMCIPREASCAARLPAGTLCDVWCNHAEQQVIQVHLMHVAALNWLWLHKGGKGLHTRKERLRPLLFKRKHSTRETGTKQLGEAEKQTAKEKQMNKNEKAA